MGITLKDLNRSCENCISSIYSSGSEKFVCDSDRPECRAMFREAEMDGLKYPSNCGGFEIKSKISKNKNRYKLQDGITLQFITAGNSYFVLYSTKTNEEFMFNVKASNLSCINTTPMTNMWFVYNWQGMYIGAIKFDRHKLFQYKINSNLANDKVRIREIKSLTYVMNKTYQYEEIENLEFYHTGFCARCGRALKEDKLAMTVGFSSHCAQKVNDEYFKIIYNDLKENMKQ